MRVLLLSAMEAEIRAIPTALSKSGYIQGLDSIWRKGNMEVLIARTGIGKINAALTTKTLISSMAFDYIIHSGLAGSNRNIPVGSIVAATKLYQHDMDLTAFGNKPGQCEDSYYCIDIPITSFTHKIVNIINEHFNVLFGSIASGDQFISDKEKSDYITKWFDPMAVDMESYAVGYVCARHNMLEKLLILRYISDSASEGSDKEYLESKTYQPEEIAKLLVKCLDEVLLIEKVSSRNITI